jgi:hypothetical protein
MLPGGSASPGNCTIAIYTTGGASLLTSATATCTVPSSDLAVVSVTGLTPFTLTSGTEYRVCYCAANTGFNWLITRDGFATGATVFHAYNAIATNTGTAANSCTATTAAPPSSTGSLASDQIDAAVVYTTKE